MITGMCTACGHVAQRGHRISDDSGCPQCGDQMHAPFNLDEQVTVTLSKDELQLLAKWAYRFAELDDIAPKITSSSRAVVTFVLDRLALQTDISLFPQQRTGEGGQP